MPAANWVHQVLGLWEDGEPVHDCSTVFCEYTDGKKDYSKSIISSNEGDGTVLAASASIENDHIFTLAEEHSNLPLNQEVINKVHEYLGTGATFSGQIPSLPQKLLLFLLRSPANIMITDPSGQTAGFLSTGEAIPDSYYDEDAKLVLIPDYETGEYKLTVTGEETGNYGLFLGRVNENGEVQMEEYLLPTNEGKIDKFNFDSGSGELLVSHPSILPAGLSLETRLKELYFREKNIHVRLALKFLEMTQIALKTKNWILAELNLKLCGQRMEHYFFQGMKDKIGSSWNDSEVIFGEIKRIYELLAGKRSLFPRSIKSLQARFVWQKKEFERINTKFLADIENGKKKDEMTAIIFLASGKKIQEIEMAIESKNYSLADFILSWNHRLLKILESEK